MKLIRDESAVSEVIGEVLMVAIVVIAFGVIATVAYSYFTGPSVAPNIDVTGIVNEDLDKIYLKHNGGEWIEGGDFKVLLRINGTIYQYNHTGEWRLGDTIEINTSSEYGVDLKRGEEVEALLVHLQTGKMISSGKISSKDSNCLNDTTAPSSVTNLRNTTFEAAYIIWAWTKPSDEDYSNARIYIDGEYKGTTSANWYNATGFDSGTDHTIAIRTVDTCGNMNSAWVNDTAGTKKTWWNQEWTRRAPITISSSNELTNHQIRLYVNYDADMQSDFDDLRFTTLGDSPISYWIEEKTDGVDETVWVKVPSITEGNTTIYLYYGNTSASSSSSGAATFEFFDDFEVWNGWSNYGSGTVEQASYDSKYAIKKNGSCDPNGGYKLIGSSVTNYRLIVKERRDNEGSDCSTDCYGIEDPSYNGYSLYRVAHTAASGDFGFERRTTASSGDTQSTSIPQAYNNWYITELKRDGSNFNVSLYKGDDRSYIGSKSGIDSAHSGPFDRVVIRGGIPYYIDWIALAKFDAPEPTCATGNEEEY